MLLLACWVGPSRPAAGADRLPEELRAYDDPVFQRQALVLARRALQGWVGATMPTEASRLWADLPPCGPLLTQRGVFVSLETRRSRQVRGCRGTLVPRSTVLAREIVANVREAALRDPLHRPVEAGELAGLRIILCVPGAASLVAEGERWNPQTDGLLVRDGEKAAVMLPWEAPDCAHQVAWGRKRAGIQAGRDCALYRFPAVRFAESEPRAPVTPERVAPRRAEQVPWW